MLKTAVISEGRIEPPWPIRSFSEHGLRLRRTVLFGRFSEHYIRYRELSSNSPTSIRLRGALGGLGIIVEVHIDDPKILIRSNDWKLLLTPKRVPGREKRKHNDYIRANSTRMGHH